MKKLLLAGALAIVGLFNAQESKGLKGTWFATAQLGYQQTKSGNVKKTNSMAMPIVGTFVAPTTAVGLGIGYIGVKNENELASNVNVESNLFVVQPLVRKYWNVAGGLFFFGQLAAPIINGKAQPKLNGTDIPNSDIKVSQFGLAASGGFDYVVTKHFTVEFSYNLINLSQTTLTPAVGDKTTVTDLSVAHVATVDSSYNDALYGSMGNAVTPLSFGFKFLF